MAKRQTKGAALAKPHGKWGHLVGKLKKLSSEHDLERQQTMEALKSVIIDEHREAHGIPPTAGFLVEEYMQLRLVKEQKEAELKDVDLQLDSILQMLEKQYEAEGIQFLKLADGSSLGMHVEPHAVVTDQQALKQWAIRTGIGDLVTLPWPTANSQLKLALEKGQPEPDGVEAYLVTKWSRRGA